MIRHVFPIFALIFASTITNIANARSPCDEKTGRESLSKIARRVRWSAYLPEVRLSYSFKPRRLGPLADLSNAFQDRIFDKSRPLDGLHEVEDHILSTLNSKHQVFVSLSFNLDRLLFGSDEVRVFRAARKAADKSRRWAHRFNAKKKAAAPDSLKALIVYEYANALANINCST